MVTSLLKSFTFSEYELTILGEIGQERVVARWESSIILDYEISTRCCKLKLG